MTGHSAAGVMHLDADAETSTVRLAVSRPLAGHIPARNRGMMHCQSIIACHVIEHCDKHLAALVYALARLTHDLDVLIKTLRRIRCTMRAVSA
nr:MAG TPA: hypothetical protein [Inoviridae sp.]